METPQTRVENHQALVASLATQIHKRLPPFIPYDDVLAYGQLGLAQAARTYQPQPGTKFSSYAYYRIKGAIYDGLVRMNWTTRAEYRRYRSLQMANEAVETNTESTDAETPESNAKWFSDTVENLATVYVFSSADSENPIENQLEGNEANPEQAAENKELCQKLHRCIKNLDADEQQLITLTYFEGMSLAEAAKRLGRSRSWGSRTHAKALKSLGGELKGIADFSPDPS